MDRPPQPPEIRTLAGRFERASGRPIEITPTTAMLVAHALRACADHLSRPKTEEIGLFAADVVTALRDDPQTVCVTGSSATARSAYEIAISEYPDCTVTLPHAWRVLARREPKG